MENVDVSDNSICWDYFENLPECFYNDMKQKQGDIRQERHSVSPHSEQLTNILKQFSLSEYFPSKLSTETVLSFRDDMFETPKTWSAIPWFILRNIISINFNFRDTILEECIQSVCPESSYESEEEFNDSDNYGKSLCNAYPLDILLALFQCCDPFLKMVIAQKMFMCQLAIPMIYNDFVEDNLTFSLWPIREIITSTGVSVAWSAMKTVSFMRLGSGPLNSKSKFINEIIRGPGQEHSTFFHMDCPLGKNNRTVSNGLVETSWYVPNTTESDGEGTEAQASVENVTGKSKRTDTITDTLTIFNLRGNATDYEKQRDLLVNISTLCVLLIEYDNLEEESNIRALSAILRTGVSVILLTNLPQNEKRQTFIKRYKEKTGIDTTKTTIVSTFSLRKGRTLNASELNQYLWNSMSAELKKSDRRIRLADILEYLPDGISCDEENTMCVTAKSLADRFISLERRFTLANVSNRKDLFLPLQGEHLKKWGKTMKQQSRSGHKETYDVDEKLLKEMNSERMKQIEQCNRSPTLFAEFIKSLSSITDNATLLYFLSWIKQHLDTESRNVLPKLLKELHDALEKHEIKKSEETEGIVDKADQRLIHASFGIEHFFREIGQVYEAFMYTETDKACQIKPNTRTILEQLPKVVARLLLLGQPLEIMVGDVACVPIKWIKAVFKSLIECVGDKRLFAISVIGVQSSGKSTLLNTMFGLQFMVSAGRCTRGMSIHLVRVDDQQSSLPFEYAMVIDTEGLRAPELSGGNLDHDNELATLVFGLGDVVIISIKGETLADMEEILEIVVHGLLRLKQANEKLVLQQFCALVHENVSAPHAATHMLQGKKNTIQNLDNVTKEVASHVHMANITSFRQVIEFNPLQHVKHISDLWQGCPPMGPASPRYSEKVTDLTKCVLQDMTTRKNYFLMSDTCLQLEALWNGILTEDFIFSFRNCLEVKAYSSLEAKYQELVWTLEKFKLEWWNNNIRPMLSKSESCEVLEKSERHLIIEFTRCLGEIALKVDTELKEFFNTSELRDHMRHWKEIKLRSIDALATCLKEDIVKKIRYEKEQCMHKLHINAERSIREKQINNQATTLAQSLKGTKASREILNERFNEMWKVWFDAIVLTTDDEHQQRLKQELKDCLYAKYTKDGANIEKERNMADIDSGGCKTHLKDSIGAIDITQQHINLQGHWKTHAEFLEAFQKRESNLKQKTLDVINRIFARIDTYIAKLFKQDTEYEKTQFSQILKFIMDAFDTHNDLKSQNEFTMTPVLQIKVALQASRYAFEKFKVLIKKYQGEHSLQSLLEAYKPDASQLFTDIVEAKTEEIIAANIVGRDIKSLIQERIQRDIPIKIQTQMRGIYTFRKYHLIIAVLQDLAENCTFSEYAKYLDNPEKFVLKWLTKETIKTVFKKTEKPSLYMEWVEKTLLKLIHGIKEDVSDVTHTDKPSDITGWVTSFRKRLEKQSLLMSSNTFEHVADHTVSDFDSFITCVNDQLSEKEQELRSYFNGLSSGQITWEDKTPYLQLFEFLWGCTGLCPWCNEPCQKADATHATSSTDDCHTCIQHRPCGLGRIHHVSNKKLSVQSCNFQVQSTQTIVCTRSWCNCTDSHEREEADVSNLQSVLDSQQPVEHPCRDYKTYIPAWDIAPSSDMSSSKYWIWFFVTYNDELAAHYHSEPADIPDSWRTVTKDDALRSLREYVL